VTEEALIYSEPDEVNSRLSDLGLDKALLVQAVQQGFAAWPNCTENHPTVIPGIWGWGEAVRALREQLILRGWERSNETNLPYIVNPSRTIAISVATGDADTGRRDGTPSTTSAKGPVTAGAVHRNQLYLFAEMEPNATDGSANGGRETWMLPMHRDRLDSHEVRCELSKPINMNQDGRIDGWVERIILKPAPAYTVVSAGHNW